MQNLKLKISNFKDDKGFTLIELIVVMAVFLFVIGAAIGIFISIIQNQKKVLSETQVLNQISYVEEYMSKALRMARTSTSSQSDINCLGQQGYFYLLTRPVTSGSNTFFTGIKFINPSANDACQEFFLDADNVLKEIKDGGTPVALTSTDMQFDPINPIRFSINGLDGTVFGQGCSGNPAQCGASNANSVQPRVTILLNIKIAGDSGGSNRIIQTTISQRNLNVLSP